MNEDISITYSTSQIAGIVGLHPNTVRLYEEYGLIAKPERKKNGYRVFTVVHLKQLELVKKAFQIEVLQAGLRKLMIGAVKLSAIYQFDEAIGLVEEYIRVANQEIGHAKEAAGLCEVLCHQPKNNDVFFKRSQAAKELGLSIDTIRNWEMNGLLSIKRKENGYRIYDSNDMNRLKIIRSLRCANYSLSAILRMLNKWDDGQQKSKNVILNILNTPDEEEDILSVCDRLVDSLEKAIKNAYEVILIIKEINEIKKQI